MHKILLTTAALFFAPASLAAGPFDDLAQVEVLSGWRMPSGDHIAALRITLEPGWKTYWRAPGDAGIPPQFAFEGSENITNITPHWPVPDVFRQNGMRSIGYHDSVVVPITVTTRDRVAQIEMNGRLTIGVCEEICIPVTLDFQAILPPSGDRDTSITAALIDRPLTAKEAGVGRVTCSMTPIDDGLQVTTTVEIGATGGSEVVVIEAGDPSIWVSEAAVTRHGNQLQAKVDMVNNQGTAFALDRSAVRITVLGRDKAIDIHGCTAG